MFDALFCGLFFGSSWTLKWPTYAALPSLLISSLRFGWLLARSLSLC